MSALVAGMVGIDTEAAFRTALIDQGFDDTSPTTCLFGEAFCSPSSEHPNSLGTYERTATLRVAYRLADPWTLDAVFGTTARSGRVTGYQDRGRFVYLDMSLRTISLAINYELIDDAALAIGLGPTLFSVDVPSSSMREMKRLTKVGAVAQVVAEVPANTRVFALVLAQYRWTTDAEMGPIPTTGEAFGGIGTPMEPFTAPVRHFGIAAGLGIRLR